VALPRGETFIKGRVTQRKLVPDGAPLGIADRNLILDTREYKEAFVDGSIETYAANLIAENLY
jgi:DNA helicase TIP49 (TBP-interacting protein)